MQREINIYTDGSSLGNPGPGGWAAVILDTSSEGEKAKTILRGGESNTTNNRMEMQAATSALKWIKKHGPRTVLIKLYSDSELVVNTINEGWKRKANLDLWRKLDGARRSLEIEWIWVKGHADNEWNRTADELAVSEAERIASEVKNCEPAELKIREGAGYFCGKCNKYVKGVLGFMPDSEMIRCECEDCGTYIMFAEKTAKNMRGAKKRVLLSREQLEKVLALKGERGEVVSENDLKKIKAWTACTAGQFLTENQKLL